MHMVAYEEELSSSISLHFYHVLPYLRQALFNFMQKRHPDYVQDNTGDREFHVAFHNLPLVSGLRELKTAKVGRKWRKRALT
jgi:DNA replication licensing factor MCM6